METQKNFLNIYSPTNNRESEPTTLGSGYITGILGEGGAAVVYEIWNPQLEIHRAVKLWRPNFSTRDLQRFETEIKITSKLDHPNIVEIHTVGEWNGLPYIEMEKIDGFSLQQLLKTHGSLPPAVALAITQFVCRALIYAHQEEISLYGRRRKGIIHCDIKPANIMITRNGVVKLMDFGIANPANVSLNSDPHKITGSLQYMAPEQIRSQSVDPRTDIYSVGVVLYEMLSGTKAFPSKQLLDIIEKRKANEFVPLEHFCLNLPKKIYKIVEKCMKIDPEERYQSAAELMKDITSVYKKLTKEDPQLLLQQYIENGGIIVSKNSKSKKEVVHIPHSLFYTITGAVVAFLLFVVLFIIVSKIYNREEKVAETTLLDKEKKRDNSYLDVKNIISKEKDHLSLANNNSQNNTSQVEIVSSASELKEGKNIVTEEKISFDKNDLLTYLERLIESGNLNTALQKFETTKIEDGAYYYLYARCLYESGDWKRAYEVAEISLKIPSYRVSEEIRKGQYLLYKARYLSREFDRSPSDEKAIAAVSAWEDVKRFYRGSNEMAKISYATTEISRIEKALNRVSTSEITKEDSAEEDF